MRVFTDNKGIEHRIDFTIGTMRKIKKELDFDLTSLTEQGVIELMQDLILCIDILHIATDTALSADDFAERLGGDSCENAVNSMFEALSDFFPRSRRGTMQAVVAKVKSLTEEAYATAQEQIEAIEIGALSPPPQD